MPADVNDLISAINSFQAVAYYPLQIGILLASAAQHWLALTAAYNVVAAFVCLRLVPRS